jgi:hypothetical protein
MDRRGTTKNKAIKGLNMGDFIKCVGADNG